MLGAIGLNPQGVLSVGQLFQQAESLSAEALMLQVQMMIAEQFDQQMRDIASQIKFLNKIKKQYREHINTIQRFMAQNPNTSRKDGKKYYEASAAEMAELMGALVVLDYNMETQEIKTQGMTLNDDGKTHSADEAGVAIENGHSSTTDWQEYFAEGAKITDKIKAREYAGKIYGDEGDLPFYYGHTNNLDEDGFPKFAVFADSLDKMLEQIKNKMSDMDEKAEELSVRLTQLTAQRKAALDGANQLIRKMEQMKTNTINKM